MFLYCTSQGVVTIVKWLISLVVTSNHKCLNKVVFNKLALTIFESRTQPRRWYNTYFDEQIKCIKQMFNIMVQESERLADSPFCQLLQM